LKSLPRNDRNVAPFSSSAFGFPLTRFPELCCQLLFKSGCEIRSADPPGVVRFRLAAITAGPISQALPTRPVRTVMQAVPSCPTARNARQKERRHALSPAAPARPRSAILSSLQGHFDSSQIRLALSPDVAPSPV